MSPLVELSCGSVYWQIEPELLRHDQQGAAAGLFLPDGPALNEWIKSGQATVIKHGPHQSVYRVVLSDLDFYLKHYRVANTRAWLRTLLRPAKARLEFERTRMAADRGLPTLTTWAAGETLGNGHSRESYLVTRTLPGALPLSGYLESTLPTLGPAARTRVRQRIAVSLGQLLARMHFAGVTYRDLHPGNLLLQFDTEGRPLLYLIDLYAVSFGRRLSARASRANLIILNRWFILRSERSDRLRCWLAYARTRKALEATAKKTSGPWWRRMMAAVIALFQGPSGKEVRQLERGTLRSNLQFWRGLDRRCLGTNRHFRFVRRGSVAGHVVATLDGSLVEQLLYDPDQPFRRDDVKQLKKSPSSTVIELPADATPVGKPLIFKRFAVTKWSDPWVSLVRPTPALRSYVQGHGFGLRFLPTPRPLAVLHRQPLGMPCEGYLLTEKVEDAVDLLAFVDQLRAVEPSLRQAALRRVIAEVARLVCTLHQRRLSHRDLKAANLLVRKTGEAAECSVWFIDLVGVVRHLRLRRDRRVQNLARLHTSFFTHPLISKTDKLRFLQVYLRWGLRGKPGWKTWWRLIEEATRVKIARNLRNRRPLG
jgi:tRNA A-37 threonylcarbamoyl transferase component Bud32